jgi:hypothetical protein
MTTTMSQQRPAILAVMTDGPTLTDGASAELTSRPEHAAGSVYVCPACRQAQQTKA